ncbi:hypothetical protein H8E77_14205 [bacterium]|nr:hypothetical protein [bacterium]
MFSEVVEHRYFMLTAAWPITKYDLKLSGYLPPDGIRVTFFLSPFRRFSVDRRLQNPIPLPVPLCGIPLRGAEAGSFIGDSYEKQRYVSTS